MSLFLQHFSGCMRLRENWRNSLTFYFVHEKINGWNSPHRSDWLAEQSRCGCVSFEKFANEITLCEDLFSPSELLRKSPVERKLSFVAYWI